MNWNIKHHRNGADHISRAIMMWKRPVPDHIHYFRNAFGCLINGSQGSLEYPGRMWGGCMFGIHLQTFLSACFFFKFLDLKICKLDIKCHVTSALRQLRHNSGWDPEWNDQLHQFRDTGFKKWYTTSIPGKRRHTAAVIHDGQMVTVASGEYKKIITATSDSGSMWEVSCRWRKGALPENTTRCTNCLGTASSATEQRFITENTYGTGIIHNGSLKFTY